MTDHDDKPNLGTDGTIPNTEDGIALGHNPNGSNFNPEEDNPSQPAADLPDGSGTTSDTNDNDGGEDDTASGGPAQS